jgi:hypothetical protein
MVSFINRWYEEPLSQELVTLPLRIRGGKQINS